MSNELIPMESLTVATVESVFVDNGLEPYLKIITEEAESFIPDTSTDKGRKAIASMARKVAKSKTFLDGLGKDLNAEAKAKAKIVDNERKRCREYLDELRDKVRAPLDEYEEKIKAAKAAQLERYENLKSLCSLNDGFGDQKPVNQLFNSIIELKTIDVTKDEFGEYELMAFKAKTEGLTNLQNAIDKLEAERIAEEERVEAERIKQERLQKERDEQIKREAEEEAERKRQADAEQAELDKQAAAKEAQDKIDAANRETELAEKRRIAAEKQAKQDKIDAAEREKQAAIDAAEKERKRQADEQAEQKRQADAREADKENKANIYSAMKIALMEHAGLSEEDAINTVNALGKNLIPHSGINY